MGENGRVVAFNAHPDNARRLQKSLRADVRERVVVENLAVTDGRADRVTLHSGRRHASQEWNVLGTDFEGRPTPAELQIPATSLDTYVGEQQLQFVKLDVERAEAAVLRGMRRLLRAQRPVLAVEFHTEDGWAGRDELLDAGYRMESLGGEALDVGRSAPRFYQCLALPS